MKKTFIIAEMSANHNQDYDIAMRMIEAMKKAGADAVKTQTYTADTLTIDCNNEYFKINSGTIWDGKMLYQLYKEAYTPWEWLPKLKSYAESLGLIFFSTPFDKSAVDFLEKINNPIYKIASFEITDIPLIKYVASKGKPVIVSAGIASFSDLEEALRTCRDTGNDNITVLQCTSSYPAPIERANLLTIPNIKETFGVKVGISDHTLGSDIAVAAVALGAEIVEKHFILDRKMGGVDSPFSMEPGEFRKMVDSIRNVEKALGKIDYSLTEEKIKSRIFAHSLFIVKDLKKGEVFTGENVRSIRPGNGLPPKHLDDVLGKKAKLDIYRGTPLKWEMIDLF